MKIVEKHISPRLTKFYSWLGFVNREKLTQTIKSLREPPKDLIPILTKAGIIKWRYQTQKIDIKNLEPHMLSGRISSETLEKLPEEIKNLFQEFTSQKAGFLPRLFGINQPGAKIAFILGALATLPLYPFVGFFLSENFNPNFWPGKYFKLGKDLFPWVLGPTLIAAGIYAYLDSKEALYTNSKDISFYNQENSLMVRVCKSTCKTSYLLEFPNPAEVQKAIQNLNEAVKDQSLFQNNLKIDEGKLLIVSRYVPSWLDWLPFTSVRVFSLSHLPEQIQKQKFAEFFSNLWASGVMPSPEELTQSAIKKFEEEMGNFRFRDPNLEKTFELANLYYAAKDYSRTILLTNEIIRYPNSVTVKTPIEYHEAIFLQTEAWRILTMRRWQPDLLQNSLNLLFQERQELSSEEIGYLARYNYELLKSCVMGELFFPKINFSQCQEAKLQEYRAGVLIPYTPTYFDNFLAIRTFLEYAKHLSLAQKSDEAKKELSQALFLLDLIDDCANAFNNSSQLSPYLKPQDRLFGQHAPLSYAIRCELMKIARGDFWPFNNDQFNQKLFGFLRARTLLGYAEIELQLADKTLEDKIEHLNQARGNLENALNIVRGIMQRDPFKFFTIMYEEKETYYEVLIAYAETLWHLYQNNPQAVNLEDIEKYAREIENMRKTEPDIIYLKSLFLLGNLEWARAHYQEAAKFYERALQIISQAETESQKLPPHFKMLKEATEQKLYLLRSITHE